jgi:hypothetical protein
MEYRIVDGPPPEPYPEPELEFHRMSKISECLDSEDPVRELYLQGVHREMEEGGIDHLSWPARVIYLAHLFDGEMLNGGMDQYLTNSSGDYSRETIAALETLNAHISVSILNEALQLLNLDDISLKDRDCRIETIESKNLSDEFENIDHRFYENVHSLPEESDEPEHLWKLCLIYLQQHSDSPIDAEAD